MCGIDQHKGYGDMPAGLLAGLALEVVVEGRSARGKSRPRVVLAEGLDHERKRRGGAHLGPWPVLVGLCRPAQLLAGCRWREQGADKELLVSPAQGDQFLLLDGAGGGFLEAADDKLGQGAPGEAGGALDELFLFPADPGFQPLGFPLAFALGGNLACGLTDRPQGDL